MLDREPIGGRGDRVDEHLGGEVADHRQVEDLGHVRDLHEPGKSPYPEQVDHHDIE